MKLPSQDPRILGPDDERAVELGSFDVRFMVWSEVSGGGFPLMEHPISPRALAAPLHRHANEDGHGYVLQERMRAQLGEEVVYMEKGDLVVKPRARWHTFWSAGDGPCRILEAIAPGSLDISSTRCSNPPGTMASETATALDARSGLEVDRESVARLCEGRELTFPVEE